MLDTQFAKFLYLFRSEGAGKEARLAVFVWLYLRKNSRSRAWGNVETIAHETGFGKPRVIEALDWLRQVGAVMLVDKSLRMGKECRVRGYVYELTGTLESEQQSIQYFIQPVDTETELIADATSSESEPQEVRNGTESEPKNANGTVSVMTSSISELVSSQSVSLASGQPVPFEVQKERHAAAITLYQELGGKLDGKGSRLLAAAVTVNHDLTMQWIRHCAANPSVKYAPGLIKAMVAKGEAPDVVVTHVERSVDSGQPSAVSGQRAAVSGQQGGEGKEPPNLDEMIAKAKAFGEGLRKNVQYLR